MTVFIAWLVEFFYILALKISELLPPYGAVGGIRTLVPLLTTTRFPVVLVMTSSIPLHIRFADKQHGLLYQKYQVCQDGIFGVSCGIDSKYLSQHNV